MIDDDAKIALLRLGASRDADPLRALLFNELQLCSGPDLSDGALRQREGRRTFASELIAKLGFGAGASNDHGDGNRSSAAGNGHTARADTRSLVRVPADEPGAGKRARSTRRPR